MRVVGSIYSSPGLHCPAIVTFVRVLWVRPLGFRHRAPAQEHWGARRGGGGQATQISLCSLMVNILSCGLAAEGEVFQWCRVQCLALLHPHGDSGSPPSPLPRNYLLLAECNVQTGHWGAQNVISQPLDDPILGQVPLAQLLWPGLWRVQS